MIVGTIVNVKMLPHCGAMPAAQSPGAAGIDLQAWFPEDDSCRVLPGQRVFVPTGICIEAMADHVAGFVFSRSGLGAKTGLTVAQGVGVIDPDYRGEIMVPLLNTSFSRQVITRGDRIAQLVLLPFVDAMLVKVDELGETTRGAGGFGSTGA